MAQFINNLQEKIKITSSGAALLVTKAITGLILGLTIALVGQEIFGFGNLLFIFVIALVGGLFFRKAREWQWTALFVFNLICVLIGLLLRMYILVAPGA